MTNSATPPPPRLSPPKRKRRVRINYSLETLRGDLFGGVTAAVVGLPVALAFGVASGVGPIAGMYGAVAVGFFAAVFGGTRAQISGPTAPMTIAMAVIVTQHAHTLAEAFTVVMMAGVIQFLLGLLRVGRVVAYTPYSVVSGFMSGIGITVIVVQLAPFVGAPVVVSSIADALLVLPQDIAHANLHAVIVASTTLLVGILWPRQFSRWFPGTLAAMMVGTALGIFWLNDLPVIGEAPVGLPELQMPELAPGFLLRSLAPAVILALLGAIDSLLNALIADGMTRTRHNPNRELMGQGIANIVAGVIGGLPGAGNLTTAVNIRSGGRTPVAGALRAIILLSLVLGLDRYVGAIPHAALAGILVKVGWDFIDRRYLARAHRIPRERLLVMGITLILTIFLDLVTAIAIGLIAAGMVSARQLERRELDRVLSVPLRDYTFLYNSVEPDDIPAEVDEYTARVGMVALRGTFTVASSRNMVNTIGAEISEHQIVILDFSDTIYLDDSAAMMVEQMIEVAREEDTEVIVMGLTGPVERNLRSLNIFRNIPDDRFVDTLYEARDAARDLLNV